jgi:hypothetical protein
MPVTDTKTAAKADTSGNDPQWFKVRSSFPTDMKKVLFRSVSRTRAEKFIVNRFPRGEEAYLELPDGTTLAYAQERQGEHGTDTDKWAPFDPEAWRPPAEQEPPGQSVWGDVES